MNATQCVEYYNRIPGFYASSPTAGHVQIHSAYWVGHVTYYPGKGSFDVSNVSSKDQVTRDLHALASEAKAMPAVTLLKTVFATEVLASMLSNMCNALRACE